MSWILFSILAALFWSITNIADKYIMTKLIRKPAIPILIAGFLGLVISFIIYPITGWGDLSPINFVIVFIVGIFSTLMAFTYFKATQIEEISRVSTLFYMMPLFVLILAAIFLNETLTYYNYFGVFLLVSGAMLISLKKFKFSSKKAFLWMLGCTVSLAIQNILTKYLLGFADFWTIFSYTRIGVLISLLPFVYYYLPDLITTIKKNKGKVVGLVTLNELMGMAGLFFITIAMAKGPVTLVHALSSVQPFFVLIFVILISVFKPTILKEELGKTNISMKVLAITLMLIGAILIT